MKVIQKERFIMHSSLWEKHVIVQLNRRSSLFSLWLFCASVVSSFLTAALVHVIHTFTESSSFLCNLKCHQEGCDLLWKSPTEKHQNLKLLNMFAAVLQKIFLINQVQHFIGFKVKLLLKGIESNLWHVVKTQNP